VLAVTQTGWAFATGMRYSLRQYVNQQWYEHLDETPIMLHALKLLWSACVQLDILSDLMR